MLTKMQATTRLYSTPQATNETLQENIQRFTDLAIQATGTDLTAVTCQVAVLFIIHLVNKEIKKQVEGSWIIQTLRNAITLAQEAEIKLRVWRLVGWWSFCYAH